MKHVKYLHIYVYMYVYFTLASLYAHIDTGDDRVMGNYLCHHNNSLLRQGHCRQSGEAWVAQSQR